MPYPTTTRPAAPVSRDAAWLLLAGLLPLPGSAQGPEFAASAESSYATTGGAPSDEGVPFLILPVGAQAIAMGRAITALSSQESAFWNPAGLASVKDRRLFFYRGDRDAGPVIALSYLAGRESVGTLGISYHELNAGDIPATSPTGEITGSTNVRTNQGVVSFATELVNRVSMGASFKVVQYRLGCRGLCTGLGSVTATSYAVDGGVQATLSDAVPLRIGLMIAHLGPDLQVVNAEQADPLPVRARVAAAYTISDHLEDLPLDMRLAVELAERWRDLGSPSVYGGIEISTTGTEVLSIRAGYAHESDGEPGGPAFGLGLRLNRLELGVAWELTRTSLTTGSKPVHVSLGVVL